MSGPLVFIQSYERPLYLWSCLDSLYHNTKTACRFVLVDNASTDPLVHRIIDAFKTRGMFQAVHLRKENTSEAIPEALRNHSKQIGEYFGFIEADAALLPAEPCWLDELMSLAAENPRLAIIGSLIDKTDFPDPELAAKHFPQFERPQLEFLIKSMSPERRLQGDYAERLIDPFNPPGRVLYLKKEFIDKVGWLRDKLLYETCKRMGYEAGIATRVRHRHLSLQNVYDYPEFDVGTRNAYFNGLEGQIKP